MAALPTLPSIAAANAMADDEFFRNVHMLFETAPPLAAALLQHRPYASWEALIASAGDAVARMTPAERLAVIDAHPRIGVRPAAAAQLSSFSRREQGMAADAAALAAAGDESERQRLAAEQEAVYAELEALNAAYEKRFGFKFVVFVNGRPKAALLPVLKERLQRDAADELALGLSEMLAIAGDRLKKLQLAAAQAAAASPAAAPPGEPVAAAAT